MRERKVKRIGTDGIYGGYMRNPNEGSADRNRTKTGSGRHFSAFGLRLTLLLVVLALIVYALAINFAITAVVVNPKVKSLGVTTSINTAAHANIRQRNLISLDEEALRASLIMTDATIENVSISRDWPHGINVTVKLKQPSLAWQSGGLSYILDEDGRVMDDLGGNQGGMALVVDSTNLPVTAARQQVASSKFVLFIQELTRELLNAGVKSTRYEVKDTMHDLYATSEKGIVVIFDTGRDARVQVEDYCKLKTWMAEKGKNAKEYIDLRVQGRAYYK